MDHFSFSIFKHFAVVKALLFFVSFNFIEIQIEATTLTHHKPNVFLESYAYCDDSDRSIIIQRPSEMAEFQSRDEFQDKHMKKINNHYVAMKTTCGVIFKCEADHPIYWTAAQKVNDLPQPEILFNTVDFRIRNCSEKCMKAGLYKSFLNIVNIFDKNNNDPIDLIAERGLNHNWTFTCSYKSDMSTSESITFQTIDPVKDPFQKHIPNDLTPDHKIGISILKRDDSKQDSDHVRNLTVLNLDNSFLSDYTVVNFDESGILVVENVTRGFDDYKITKNNGFLVLDSPDLPVETKLLEYGIHEDIRAGDSIHFVCFSLLDKFYLFGGFIQINWKNGSNTILEDRSKHSQGIQISLNLETSKPPVYRNSNNESMLPYYLATKLILYLSPPVIASEEMASVDCFMPKPINIEDGPWDKSSRPLKIHPKM